MKRLRTSLIIGGLLATAFSPLATRADDIDLYTGGEGSTGAATNVLLVLDNSANWSAANQNWPDDGGKQGKSELATLYEVVGTLSDNVNVGLMTFAANGSDWEGQVRFHIRKMDLTNRGRLQQIMEYMKNNAVDGSNADEVSSSTNYDILMNGALRYFNGLKRNYAGTYTNNAGEDRKDFKDNPAVPAYDPASNPSGYTWAYESANQTTYNKPADTAAGCAKNFIIFIGNGFPSGVDADGTNLTNAAADLSAAAGRTLTADTTQITSISPKNPYADEFARFMYKVGVPTTINDPYNAGQKLNNSIVTYTIDVCKDHCEDSQATLLKSMAKVGGGKYFKSTSKSEIKTAIATIFAEIQAVNSVFASATLPISVNTQGTYENQVYIGTFRPDGSARQRWYGNLKEYKFGRYCDIDGDDKVLVDSTRTIPLTGTYSATDERVADDVAAPDCGKDASNVQRPVKLYLADQNGNRAIDESGNTGFIDQSAVSYWTSSSSFWTFLPTTSGSTSDSPDGPEVERGGAAQKLRTLWATSTSPDGRSVYTCLGNCLLSSGSASEKTLSNNLFSTSNTAVTTALAAPSGSSSVTLSRTGNTVTGTATANHNFNPGDSVVIAGATPTGYNGTKTLLTASGTTFTYTLSETPATSDTVTVAKQGTTYNSVSAALSTTAYGATATVTITGPTYGVANGTAMTAEITGASLSVLNGVKTGTVQGSKFTYSATLPAGNPSATLTGTATIKCGTGADETATGTWSSTTGYFTLNKSTSGNYATSPAGCRNATVGSSVLVSGASDSAYNGTWTIQSAGNASIVVGTKAAAAAITSPYTVNLIEQGATYSNKALTRTLGSQSVSVDIGTDAATAGFVNGTIITASGATDTSYNANWTVTGTSGNSITFTGPALAPTTPPTGTITATSSAATGTGPTTANLINWMRGKDLWEDENFSGTLTDVRASIHGDVLHARPVMINYGGTIGIVGFYGSNDGFLRAIAAGSGKATEPSTRVDSHTDDGNELWSFIPSEFLSYSKLTRTYYNGTSSTALVRFPNQSCTLPTSPTGRDYRWDGPITAYQTCFPYNASTCSTAVKYPDTTNGPYSRAEKTWIFAGMRRGGRAYYALDVSEYNNPKMMWRIDNNTSYTDNVSGTTKTYSDLAQTWSEPKIAKLKGTFTRADNSTTVTNPVVLVFGAGYDEQVEDQPPATQRTPTKGRGVYVVEAETGQQIAFLQPPSGIKQYSFPADVTLLDIDADGYLDRIYAGDTDANVFRFDTVQTVTNINDSANYWKSYRLAKLGDIGNNGGSNARKFLFPLEVLPFKSAGVTKVMVFGGTGDREKPLANLDSSGDPKTLASVGGCSTYFGAGSSPYAIQGTYSGTTYTYFGLRVEDYFYGIVDANQYGADPTTVNASPILEGNLKYVNSSSTSLTGYDLSDTTYKGWRIRLKTDPDGTAGDTKGEEKAVNAAKVVGGIVYFASNVPVTPNPSAGVCSNLGLAQGYAVEPFSGLPAFNRDNSTSGGAATYTQTDYSTKFSGGGLPPTVTAGVVTVGGTPYRFIIGSGGSSVTSASSVAGQRNILNLRGIRSRLYWSYGAD